jgi:hypothetical protein
MQRSKETTVYSEKLDLEAIVLAVITHSTHASRNTRPSTWEIIPIETQMILTKGLRR